MGYTPPDPEIPQPTVRRTLDIKDEHLKAIGLHFFDAFCAQHNVPDDMRPSVDTSPFMQWFPREAVKYTVESLRQAVAPAEISDDSANFMLSLPNKAYYQNHIVALWPFLTLARRTRKYEVRSVNLMLAIQYTDGTIVPMSMLAHKDVSTEPLDDAHVCHLVVTRTPDLATQLAVGGLDNLYERHKGRLTGMTDPDSIRFFKSLLAGIASGKFTFDLPPDQLASVKQYTANLTKLVSFVEQMFPAEVPAGLKAKILGQDLKKETPGGFNDA